MRRPSTRCVQFQCAADRSLGFLAASSAAPRASRDAAPQALVALFAVSHHPDPGAHATTEGGAAATTTCTGATSR